MFDRPPDRPLLIFDGDCSFCRVWVEYWQQITADRVLYAPYQEVGDCFPDIPRQQFKAAVQLVQPDGKLFGGAHAVFRLLALIPGKSSLLWLYEKAPGFAPIADAVYALIARHRSFAYRVTKLLWGVPLESETFGHASWIFLRLLGVIYLIAFLSFGVQAKGIIGSNGISPAGDFLRAAREYFGTARFWSVPTLLWLDSGDAIIQSVALRSSLCSSAPAWREGPVSAGGTIRSLSFARGRRTRIHDVPMGRAPSRSRLPRHFPRIFNAHCQTVPLVTVSSCIPFRCGQVVKPRPHRKGVERSIVHGQSKSARKPASGARPIGTS